MVRESRVKGTLVFKIHPQKPDKATLACAAAMLKNGCVLAVPTDLGYALMVDARNPLALKRLHWLSKGTGLGPATCFLGYPKQVLSLSEDLLELFWEWSGKHWPGPVT